MFDLDDYRLNDPEQLLTPCLLVYPHIVRANIAESIRIAGSAKNLRPHVKTNKTPQIVNMMREAGITKFKCATLREAQVLGGCGAEDVLIAYPQIGPAVSRLVAIAKEFPQTRFSTVVDNRHSLQQLDAAFQQAGLKLTVMMDIDTGMHRTGIPAGEAAKQLYRDISQANSLVPGGLHVYDGQNHQSDLQDRRAAVNQLWQSVWKMVTDLKAEGLSMPKLVCGGTPTFPVYAAMGSSNSEVSIECSPGTCILSDINYGRNYTDMSGYKPAAVLLTRVISKHHADRVTTDLGYKAVSADQPLGRRCSILNAPGAKEILQNEEHLVLEIPSDSALKVGDVLYAIPGHICPTVALHSHLIVVENGQVVDRWEVTARDRIV